MKSLSLFLLTVICITGSIQAQETKRDYVQLSDRVIFGFSKPSLKQFPRGVARHYAEDAGKDPDGITGPQKEYSLVAASVKIYR